MLSHQRLALVVALAIAVAAVAGAAAGAAAGGDAKRGVAANPPPTKAKPASSEASDTKQAASPPAAPAQANPRGRRSASSPVEPIVLLPELQHMDLSGGVRGHHPALAGAQALVVEVKRVQALFLAARESESAPQLRRLNASVVPELQERASRACDNATAEADELDRDAFVLRDRVRGLSARLAATPSSEQTALMDEAYQVGDRLSAAEDGFARAQTVKLVCGHATVHLEQLVQELHMTMQELSRVHGADL
jgi:hypothetical protein